MFSECSTCDRPDQLPVLFALTRTEATLEKIWLMLFETPGIMTAAATDYESSHQSVLNEVLSPMVDPDAEFENESHDLSYWEAVLLELSHCPYCRKCNLLE